MAVKMKLRGMSVYRRITGCQFLVDRNRLTIFTSAYRTQKERQASWRNSVCRPDYEISLGLLVKRYTPVAAKEVSVEDLQDEVEGAMANRALQLQEQARQNSEGNTECGTEGYDVDELCHDEKRRIKDQVANRAVAARAQELADQKWEEVQNLLADTTGKLYELIADMPPFRDEAQRC